MIAVPATTPVTVPAVLMLAMVGLPLLHAPPLAVLVNVVVAATHTLDAPLMVPADAVAVTVTVCVAAVVPQLLVTV